jgi:hypothetical protein
MVERRWWWSLVCHLDRLWVDPSPSQRVTKLGREIVITPCVQIMPGLEGGFAAARAKKPRWEFWGSHDCRKLLIWILSK